MHVMCSVSSSYRYFCAGKVSSVRVVVSSVQTNRARCALYEKMLDLLDEESISGESCGRASL